MAPPPEPPPAGADLLDPEILELEPTVAVAPGYHDPGADVFATESLPPRASAPVAIVEGNVGEGSLTGETHDLRRQRLKAVAMALAAIFGLLLIWVYLSDNPGTLAADGSPLSNRVIFLGLRCLLAVAVAGVLFSEVPLTRRQLRVTEFVLFLGVSGLMMASQYVVGLDLIHRGPEYFPILLAFIKDGVIQMLVTMMLYGSMIPNRPAVAARMLLVLVAVPFVAQTLFRMRPEAAPFREQLGEAEERGSNVLFLAIGAVLSFYGSYVLNGLRAELHDARKFGQYRLLRKIGAGGMGEVYLAEHQLLKRPCALKLIKPEAIANPTALARFEREVQSAARLSHPNTIEIYDYGHSEDGTFYYVMEFLPGMSLDELVRKAGPLPPGRAIYLLRQACAGLAEAHALGLVHRDLKPANIFVARRGGESDVAKILDYGLVKPTQDPGAAAITAELVVSGTPSYMAPEQAVASRDLDVRADVYAMGSVAYFALTGRPPFSGESAFAIMMAHARDPVIPPSSIRPGIPADLERVVLTALAKKPDDRYPDARSMGRALAASQAASSWDSDRAELWWAQTSQPPGAATGPAA
jgi:tRNA A-37 threonylcarbamoyl transferase component Bud32